MIKKMKTILRGIHAELKRLLGEMHAMEYVPDTKVVLHDVEEEEKIVSFESPQ
jgi:hypothetical protein